MSHRQLWMIRSVCIAIFLLCFSGIAGAQLSDMRIGLVAPGVGWVVQNQGTQPNPNNHLYWTANDGENWTDITPQDPASSQIAGVFFLDASRGWVLLALTREPKKGNQEPVDFVTDISGFDLASTTDGGASWTIKHLAVLPEGVGWAPIGQIFFLDAAHGWMSIESPVPHWGGAGDLLTTADGGKTWQLLVENGPYGAIRFTDLQNGWMASGPDDEHLNGTSDGGRHWREVAVPAPSAISGRFEDLAAQYALPRFKDAIHGFLAVKYSGPGKSGEDVSIQALFSTVDAGHEWHLESFVNLDQRATFPVVAMVDSTAVVHKRPDYAPLMLEKLGLGGQVTETGTKELPELQNNAALLSLNFSDLAHGWASSADGRLLSTSDGGIVWNDITPGRKKISMQAPSNSGPRGISSGPVPQSSSPTSLASATLAGSTITTYKSRHMGFDRCQAPPASPQMSTWWSSSPYFDIGIYVGGSTRSCAQPNLTSSWVRTVTGQGWGLIPVWPGPQAPCTCAPGGGTWPNCSISWTTISSTGGAYAQGQAEADTATKGTKGAMEKLGLGAGSPVYYDIENYSPSAACNGNPTGSYVNAFLSGWVSEIQNNGYIAAIYGNPAPAAEWYSGSSGYGPVSPSPNDVWITKYDNRVTIWGLTSTAGSLTDAAWPRDQRMHQYFINLTNTSEMWGGQSLVIDKNIEDADVVGGNGVKSYSFSYTTIDYYGAGLTVPISINNSGQIVGQYVDHGTGAYHGFVNTNAGFTSIDFPNAIHTYPYGINNIGEVVGYYFDQQLNEHGFLYQAGVYTSLDAPGATNTLAFGINDDEQISGYYADSLGVHHGFQYQGGTFTSINYPGAPQTETYGINGDAQIAGICPNYNCSTFLYAQGVFSYPPLDTAVAVNNNQQITGAINRIPVFEHEGSYITIAPPGSSITNLLFSNGDFLLNSQTAAKVALVGSYAVNGVIHGFLATSQ